MGRGLTVSQARVHADVFAALASPVRRDLMGLLLDGPQCVQDLAGRFDLQRPSVSEHLRVLREAGLVTESRQGRKRVFQLRPAPLMELHDWLAPYERFWRERLADFAALLDDQVLEDEQTEEPPA